MEILLASNNIHKANEIRDVLKNYCVKIFTLNDLNLEIEIDEDKNTLKGNAEKKAKEVFKLSNIPVIADDTGIFVDALNGEPGVFSSRYAGLNVTYDDNCNKLLKELKNIPFEKRTAYFSTIVCYYDGIFSNFFEGKITGKILKEKKGQNGFGYDPLFLPDGYHQTFAELSSEIKNKISHRAIAIKNFADYLIANKLFK